MKRVYRTLIGQRYSIEIERIINSIKTNTSPGADQIHPKFIKSSSHIYKFIFTDFISLIIRDCNIPDNLKHGTMYPIFKGGNKDQISNYRPIMVLDTFAKI